MKPTKIPFAFIIGLIIFSIAFSSGPKTIAVPGNHTSVYADANSELANDWRCYQSCLNFLNFRNVGSCFYNVTCDGTSCSCTTRYDGYKIEVSP